MPLYQFTCYECDMFYEIQMKIAELKIYDEGKEPIPCPKCEKPLTKLICPPRDIHIN